MALRAIFLKSSTIDNKSFVTTYKRAIQQEKSSKLMAIISISLSHAMRPDLQICHFWVAKSLFLTITFNQKKQDKTLCF